MKHQTEKKPTESGSAKIHSPRIYGRKGSVNDCLKIIHIIRSVKTEDYCTLLRTVNDCLEIIEIVWSAQAHTDITKSVISNVILGQLMC